MARFERQQNFLTLGKDHRDNYLKPLVETSSSSFYKVEQGNLLIIAAAYGVKHDLRIEYKDSVDIRLYDTLQDSKKNMIDFIVLVGTNYDQEIITDGSKTIKTLGEFANGGLIHLYDAYLDGSSKNWVNDEIYQLMMKEFGQIAD